MLYIYKDTKQLIVPKFVKDPPEKVIFEHQVDKKQYSFIMGDATPNSDVCYTFPIGNMIIEMLKPGQYNYSVLNAAGDVLSSGILQVGNFDAGQTKYDVRKEIISYEK